VGGRRWRLTGSISPEDSLRRSSRFTLSGTLQREVERLANLQGEILALEASEGEGIPVRLGPPGVLVPTENPEDGSPPAMEVAGLSGKAVQLRMAAWFEKVNDDYEESGEVVLATLNATAACRSLRH